MDVGTLTTNFIFYFLIFSLGASIGSFLNVCFFRMPINQSILYPPSHCNNCGWKLNILQNIPLLSYLFTRGRCAKCHESFSPIYLINEFIMGLGFLLIYQLYPFWSSLGIDIFHLATFIQHTTLLFFLYCIALIDYRYLIIPDKLSFAGIILGMLISPYTNIGFTTSLIGSIVGFLCIWIIIYAYYFITKTWGMGFGDAKLLALIGAYLGGIMAITTLFYACIVGSIIMIVVMLATRRSFKKEFPFGPFISMGTLFALFADPFLFGFSDNLKTLISLVF